MFFKLLIPATLLFLRCDCANILGIIPSSSYSHQIAYVNLWKELSLKGHKVTVLTTNPQRNPNLSNLTEIDLSIGYDIIEKQFNWSTETGTMDPLKFMHFIYQMISKLSQSYFQLPEVQKLIKNKGLHFDVVMVEFFFTEFLMFGELFNAPTILLTSLDASNPLHEMFQNGHHSVVYPDIYIPYIGELSFKERLTAVLLNPVINYIKSQYVSVREENIHNHFGDISLPLDVLLEKSTMLFIFASPVLLHPRPLSPRTIIVGGEATIQEPKKLSKDIQAFLDSAKNGAIYFSLGSNAKSENLGKDAVTGIIKVLKELPYSVLWKLDNASQYELPGNIMPIKWVSQQDVLRHPNVKLFITQGGMQSLEESIYFKKPMVGIPIFGDQVSNTKKLQLKGVLKLASSKPSLDPIQLRDAILEVIENSTYTENIKKLSSINLDQPMTGIERAIWWTEYVIRHKGKVEHMIHSPAKTIPFYQYYILDVGLFLLASLLSVLGSIYLLVLLLRRLFRRNGQLHYKKEA